MKKYLILTASYGSGHNAASSAIKTFLDLENSQVQILDLVDLLKKGGDNSQKFFYFSEKYPFIWDATFTLLDQKITNEILDLIFRSTYQKIFTEYVLEYSPDYIICTFPTWPIFIKNYCKIHAKTFKTGVVVTDAIEIGTPWYIGSDTIDNFFVIDANSQEVFRKKFHHEKDNVHVSFFPIAQKYFLNKENISNRNIAILLTGLDKDFVIELLHKMERENFYSSVLIIRGRNLKLFSRLQGMFHDTRFCFTEFIDIKNELKNIDIFISKPGGALMCECIAQDVPIISPSFTPGQEEGNIKLMQIENIGVYESNPDTVIFNLKFIDWNRFLPHFAKIKKRESISSIVKIMETPQ